MNIVVCIKQVPDTTEVKIDKKTNTLIRRGVKSIINPYDMHALEEALRIKEKFSSCRVTVISMGPPQAEESLKEAISMGVDDVILLSDRAFAGADTLATSYTLAEGIKKLRDTDLIICGKQAIDGDTAQVGPGIAEHMQIAHSTYVNEIKDISREKLTIKREIEDGFEIIELLTPAVITVTKKINEPRLPSIRGLLRAQDIDVPIWTADDLAVDQNLIGLDGSPTWVVSISTPQIDEEGEIFTGDVEEQVEKLLDILSEQKLF